MPSAPQGQASRAAIVGVALLVVAVLGVMGAMVLRDGGGEGGPDRSVDAASAPAPAPEGAPDPTAPTTSPCDASSQFQTVPSESDPGGAAPLPASYPCSEVDPHAWTPSATSKDLVVEVRAGTVPGPEEGPEQIGPADLSNEYPTADDFLAQSNVSDPAGRAQAMADAGYAGGIENEYAGLLPSSVQVLAFRDAGAAADYVTARLPDLCRLRGTDALIPLGDDGFAFVDGMGAVHGDFLLGGSQVSLVICGCAPDAGLAKVVHWYEEWIAQYAPPGSPGDGSAGASAPVR